MITVGVGAGVVVAAAAGSWIGATAIVRKIASAIRPTTAAIRPLLRCTARGQFSTASEFRGAIGL